jgi:hypothetical protein
MDGELRRLMANIDRLPSLPSRQRTRVAEALREQLDDLVREAEIGSTLEDVKQLLIRVLGALEAPREAPAAARRSTVVKEAAQRGWLFGGSVSCNPKRLVELSPVLVMKQIVPSSSTSTTSSTP